MMCFCRHILNFARWHEKMLSRPGHYVKKPCPSRIYFCTAYVAIFNSIFNLWILNQLYKYSNVYGNANYKITETARTFIYQSHFPCFQQTASQAVNILDGRDMLPPQKDDINSSLPPVSTTCVPGNFLIITNAIFDCMYLVLFYEHVQYELVIYSKYVVV
jgi:hypothetical protein